jgi:hypothetical protein
LSCDLNLKTPGNDRQQQERDLEDEIVEEFFGQLWVIPGSEKVRVPNPNRDRGGLVWVRKDLVREKKVGIEDCFPVRKGERFAGVPTQLSFSKDIWGKGKKTSYVDILKRFMEEGGRWVW